MKKHFDGWGNPILDHFAMLTYFRGDDASLRIIRSKPSFRWAVMPTVRITLDKSNEETFRVELVYPGGSRVICQDRNDHTLRALRSLWASPRGSWTHRQEGSKTIFTHAGRIVPISGSRSGWAD